MIVVIVEASKILLWIRYIHSFWRQKMQQANKIVQLGFKQCIVLLQMNIGELQSLKLKVWKPWMHGNLLTMVEIWILFRHLGHSRWNVFHMAILKSTKAQLCARDDQQIQDINLFGTYTPAVQWTTNHLMLILEVYQSWNQNKEMLLMHSLMLLWKKETLHLWKCLWVFKRKANCWNLIRLSIVYLTILFKSQKLGECLSLN